MEQAEAAINRSKSVHIILQTVGRERKHDGFESEAFTRTAD